MIIPAKAAHTLKNTSLFIIIVYLLYTIYKIKSTNPSTHFIMGFFHRKYILFAVMLLLVGATFWTSSHLQNLFEEATHFIERYINKNPFAAGVVFVAIAALSAILSPFSSAPLVPFLVAIWGSSLTLALLVSGWFLGGIGTYCIGRLFGSPLISENNNGTVKKIEYYRTRISRRAEFGLVLLFRLAIPSEIGGYVLGIIQYHFAKYLIATLLSEAVFGIFLVYGSDALVSQKPFLFVLLVGGMLVILGASVRIFRKRIRNHAAG